MALYFKHEIREISDVRFMPDYVWLCTEIANGAFNSIEDN